MSIWPAPPGIGWLLLISGWAAVDTTAAFQLMVGQPLVAGCLAGMAVNHPDLGLFMGASLQLLWSRLAPVGAASFPDTGPATVAGVAVAGALLKGAPAWSHTASLPFPRDAAALAAMAGLLMAILMGRISQHLRVAIRRDNARLGRMADRAAGSGSFAGVERANALGVLRSLGRGLLLLPLGLLLYGCLAFLARALHGAALMRGVFGGSGLPGAAAGAAGGPTAALPGGVAAQAGIAHDPASLGPVLFCWIGGAALLSVLWRGGRRDWVLVTGGLLLGAAARLLW